MIPPLVPIAIAFAVGILLASWLPLSPEPLLVIGLLAGGAGLGGRRHPRSGALALVILWACAGGLCAASSVAVSPADVSRLVGEVPQPARIHGVVVDDPIELFSPRESFDSRSSPIRSGRMGSEVEPEPERQVCVVRARHVGVQGRWQAATGLIRVRLQAPRLALDYGDEVLLDGRWSAVPPPGNPGQFDWRAALARQRIHTLLSVRPFDGVVRVRSHQGHWWLRGVYALRQRVEHLVQTRFTRYHAGLLRSLLLGQRVALEDDLKRAFVQTGTMHVLARQCTKLH